MKLVLAFLQLIRSLNLFFIVLTQVLFYYFVFPFAFDTAGYRWEYYLQPRFFWLIVASSVLIAAAGYIINDYFDLNIDRVNKPGKLVIERVIKRRWAIVWHWLFSFAGVALSVYVSWKLDAWIIAIANGREASTLFRSFPARNHCHLYVGKCNEQPALFQSLHQPVHRRARQLSSRNNQEYHRP